MPEFRHDGVGEYRSVIETPKKIQRQVDVPDVAIPSFLEALQFLQTQDFDPSAIRYETPLHSKDLFTYDALHLLGTAWNTYEISVLSVDEKARLITGNPEDTDYSSILPVEEYFTTLDLPPRVATSLKVPDGYTTVDDSGHFTGELWTVNLHNHPGSESKERSIPSDPYPSSSDLANAPYGAKISMIASAEGLTFFGRPAGFAENTPQGILDFYKSRHYGNIREALMDKGFTFEFSKNVQQSEQRPREFKRKICEFLQVPIRIIPWSEKATIERILGGINDHSIQSSEDVFESDAILRS